MYRIVYTKLSFGLLSQCGLGLLYTYYADYERNASHIGAISNTYSCVFTFELRHLYFMVLM